MRKINYALMMLVIVCCSCSKNSGGSNNPPPAKGPWDGTYKMIATQTIREDTMDAIPHGGNIRTTIMETSTGTSFNGTLAITKDKFNLQALGYQETTTGARKEFFSGNGSTVTTPISRTATVSGISGVSDYTIVTGKDSVTIPEPQMIARVAYGTSPKLKAQFNNTQLILSSDFYASAVENLGGQNMTHKYSYKTVTVYQKQ